MSVAALIADMVRAGVDPELIGRTAELLAAREPAVVKDEAAERRRAADRERKRLRNSAEFRGSGSPERPSTPLYEPLEFNQNLSTPLIVPPPRRQKAGEGEAMLISDGVEPETLADWKAVRKAKKAGPITETVAKAIIREAGKAGLTTRAAVRLATERGWQGFRAEFVQQARAGPAPRGSAAIADALDRILCDGDDQGKFESSAGRISSGGQPQLIGHGDGLFDGDRWRTG